ncbi:hypothetical protein B0H16DRAFT_1693536 [Mycena metata]|uniref:Uncharacterized protein n=1 Tax=Mycena metata TaxID=1033252 RepID=A0AAD7N2X0_9AGAR|nr:hypothetical protein B0H16DRAFT_1693536 [Mycena metata]
MYAAPRNECAANSVRAPPASRTAAAFVHGCECTQTAPSAKCHMHSTRTRCEAVRARAEMREIGRGGKRAGEQGDRIGMADGMGSKLRGGCGSRTHANRRVDSTAGTLAPTLNGGLWGGGGCRERTQRAKGTRMVHSTPRNACGDAHESGDNVGRARWSMEVGMEGNRGYGARGGRSARGVTHVQAQLAGVHRGGPRKQNKTHLDCTRVGDRVGLVRSCFCTEEAGSMLVEAMRTLKGVKDGRKSFRGETHTRPRYVEKHADAAVDGQTESDGAARMTCGRAASTVSALRATCTHLLRGTYHNIRKIPLLKGEPDPM